MVLRRWFRAAKFRPAYSDARVIKAVRDSPTVRRTPLLSDALVSWKLGRTEDAAALVVKHFDTRETPRFFIDSSTLRMAEVDANDLAHDAAALPWRSGTSGSDDVLFAVQPHRFGFAPSLAREAAAAQPRALRFKAVLDDWTDFARAQPDLAFISNLVVIQRLIACAWAFAFLTQADSSAAFDCRHKLLQIIVQDIAYLLPRLGESYPNNHLLLDRFADWMIALLYPEFVHSSTNLEALDRAWVAELLRQTYSDGGSVEHSMHYHGFAAEMAAAYVLLSDRNGRAVSADVRARVERILRLQACLGGVDGHAPDIGDRSDDPLFPLARLGAGNAALMRELYRALFAPQLPPLRRGHSATERAFWLLDGRLAPAPERAEEPRFVEFADSGLVLFTDDESTRCVFRTGPIERSQTLVGHMHADLMSVALVSRGVPILVDAGTYSYRFKADRSGVNWRDYFAGPRAHNGLIVGSKNPLGPLTGDFRDRATLVPIRHVASGKAEDVAFLEAEMQSTEDYPGLIRGVVHLAGVGFIVYNRLRFPAPDDDLRFAFQLAPHCETLATAVSHMKIRRNDTEIALAWSAGIGPPEIVAGRESPTHGWVSPRYGERIPAPQLLFDATRSEALTAFGFLLHRTEKSSIDCRQPTESSRCFRIESAANRDYIMLNLGPLDAPVSAWNGTFRGRLLWIRVPEAGRPVVRSIDGLSCDMAEHGLQYHNDTVQREFSD